ncbi:MAG: pGP6-D family virulence protein [Chlamydiales bacterium]|nr:pGP6-D family virulence protein [Chlamydiales bacterium]MBY0529928.1 pGP6-D family virulence protein [Rhabdochlamydiaceae bacterium]
MSKQSPFSNPAFQPSSAPAAKGYNMVHNTNNFNSVFNPQPLDNKESTGIEKLLVDFYLPGRFPETQVTTDLDQLKKITTEIKAVAKQGAVLTGERLNQARSILKPYRDGAFAQWIDLFFGSRRTAYNMLAYYELYSSLPNHEAKIKFQKLPQKVAYLLASKNVTIDAKVDIIDKHFDSNPNDLMMLIQERFPADEGDGRRKTANKSLLDSLEFGLKKLLRRKDHLSDDNIRQVHRLKSLIDDIIAINNSETLSI